MHLHPFQGHREFAPIRETCRTAVAQSKVVDVVSDLHGRALWWRERKAGDYRAIRRKDREHSLSQTHHMNNPAHRPINNGLVESIIFFHRHQPRVFKPLERCCYQDSGLRAYMGWSSVRSG